MRPVDQRSVRGTRQSTGRSTNPNRPALNADAAAAAADDDAAADAAAVCPRAGSGLSKRTGSMAGGRRSQ
jgi:hypothetical protein